MAVATDVSNVESVQELETVVRKRFGAPTC